MYQKGLGGLQPSDAKATVLFKMAADGGVTEAMCTLGIIHHDRAVDFFTAAADKGCPRGMYYLALCYLYGDGVQKDTARATDLLRKAHDKGHLNSTTQLASTLYYYGTKKNKKEALRLWASAVLHSTLRALPLLPPRKGDLPPPKGS